MVFQTQTLAVSRAASASVSDSAASFVESAASAGSVVSVCSVPFSGSAAFSLRAGSFSEAAFKALAALDSFLGCSVRQWRVVLLNIGSQTYSTAGITNRQMQAEIRAPRASMMQMAPMRSIEDTKDTPRVAQNITSALVMFCATLGVSFVSSIDLIGAICIMLARGALISACICLFVMPAVLYVCEPMFNKTTLHWRTEQPKKESKAAKALKAASEKLPARKEKAALPEKGTEQTETTEPAEAADSTKLAAESETEADAARETANV